MKAGTPVVIDGYRVCRGYGRQLSVYEEHPSGERRLVGRCESMGGARRIIERDKLARRSVIESTHG